MLNLEELKIGVVLKSDRNKDYKWMIVDKCDSGIAVVVVDDPDRMYLHSLDDLGFYSIDKEFKYDGSM